MMFGIVCFLRFLIIYYDRNGVFLSDKIKKSNIICLAFFNYNGYIFDFQQNPMAKGKNLCYNLYYRTEIKIFNGRTVYEKKNNTY